MKRIIATTSLAICLLLGAANATAQTVYKARGANGPVFTDQPLPGAKAVELPPLNVIDSKKLTGNGGTDQGAAPKKLDDNKTIDEKSAGSKEAALEYRSFSIVSPENDGSVVANTALFEVRVTLDPALHLGEGHAITVSINGRPVGQRFTATEFMIPPEFWGDQLPPPNQRLQLDAAIVDGNGKVLKEAAPVQFQMRHATLLQHPRPLKPQPTPLPLAKPAAPPAVGGKFQPDPKITPETERRPVGR
ncbi:MAG: DUF4124 domain-containing protein [Burkholderiales bacterium]